MTEPTHKAKAATTTQKRLATAVLLEDPETQDVVSFGPGHVDEQSKREVYAFTKNGDVLLDDNGQPATELPQWAQDKITNPRAWVEQEVNK